MAPIRMLAVSLLPLATVAGIVSLARLAGPDPFTFWGILVSIPGAVFAIVIIGSLYEWIVHRFIYHRGSEINLLQNIYRIHQHGHHWHRFPPDRYVQGGPIERIPVFSGNARALCGSRSQRWIAWWGQFLLYLAVAIPFAFVPAWLLTRNPLFTVSAVVTGLVVCYLFIRVHDVMHYPAKRALERRVWFRFLDRHHYIHHIDTTANLNFLLPLCDFLFGTLKLEPSQEERCRWPSFDQAKRLPVRGPEVRVEAGAARLSVIWVLLLVVGVGIIVPLGGGFYMSNLIRDEVLKPKEGVHPLDLKVVELGNDWITLGVTPQTRGDKWERSGLWGLRWEGGYAQVGTILGKNHKQVVREFFPLKGNLKAGEMVRLDLFPFPDDPQEAFGFLTKKVYLSSELGRFPATFVDGRRNTWVIFVHGKRDSPCREPLRANPLLPSFADLGFPFLLVSYRNDGNAPASPDGFHRYGLTEWEELEGAARYSLKHGAEDLILAGYSMGGAIMVNFLYRSQLADKVRGAILDAPMLDLNAVIDFQVRKLGLPRLLTGTAKLIARLQFGIDWRALNYLSRADELAVPILLFHGDADTIVPVETSDALASARPDIVTYHRVSGATHVRSWNMDPAKYEAAVREFLKKLIHEEKQ